MRIYFKGNSAAGKSTIIHNKFIQNNIKCEKYVCPLKKWRKAFLNSTEENNGTDILINNFIMFSLFNQRFKIDYDENTIYLFNRDINCCNSFIDYKYKLPKEISKIIYTELNDILKEKYKNVKLNQV